jgi:hypothetical protein
MNKKRMTMIFAVVIFSCVLSVGVVSAADESETVSDTAAQEQSYTEAPGEIGDIARYAESKVKEVNEAFEHEKENLETIKQEQYFEDYKEERSGSLLTGDDITALENKRAQRENSIRTKAGYAIEEAASTGATQKEQPPPAAAPRTISQTSTSNRGMVKGIVFYEDKGAALIAGDVVREGDEVLGVRVTKISPDFVEFDKKGNQWKQQVGQFPPPAVWEQPQQQQQAPAQRTTANPKTKK